MTYELPTETFDATAALRTRITAANMYRDNRAAQYRASYEAFWQLPLTHGDRALTLEQMQSVINAGQATVVQILQDAAAEIAFIAEQYPDSLSEKYHSAPYVYTITELGIQLQSLKPEWEIPQEEEGNE